MESSASSENERIAGYLNQLGTLGMRGIAADEQLIEVINDFFVSGTDYGEDESINQEGDVDLNLSHLQATPSPTHSPRRVPSETAELLGSSAAGPPDLPVFEDIDRHLVAGAGSEEGEAFTCTCKHYEGKPCYLQFSAEEVTRARLDFMELTKEEKDIAITSHLSSCMHRDATTSRSKKGVQTDRKAIRTDYLFAGHQKEMSKLIEEFENQQAQEVTQSHSQQTSPSLEHSQSPPQHKPRAVKYSTFLNLWNNLLPFITNLKPATDLCWYCQQRSVQMQRSVNLPIEKKSEAAKEMLSHLEDATKERSLYNSVLEEVRRNLPDSLQLSPHENCSFQGKAHYSFDFAQQVHYPSNPQQPGPIFFKTPRKCGLFGVSCEGLKKQVNFLLDESWDYGKGANTVISMLHYFFEHYGLGETEVHLHADNCCGQNKNNAMIQYLLWRVLTGKHKKITLSFLLAGHTKFSCDWGFGLIKCKFRKTVVNCLEDIVEVVDSSSVVNTSQLCATQDGTGIVPVYDWTQYLTAYCNRLPNILTFHHFYFEEGFGSVKVQELINSGDPVAVPVLKPNGPLFPMDELPPRVQTKGLSNARKWYLYKEIRPFVSLEHQDKVAPHPPADEPEPSSSADTGAVSEPVAKVSRLEISKISRAKGRGRIQAVSRGRALLGGKGRVAEKNQLD
ncbi:hypothetical protein RRG08_061423 [Elysia crispata]|uniref:DUF7869 domain-containing protein n=1 Tax=Elysia crispata TaxID=231223 RepID=A0AAE1E419_9GAST|nr:hypothetical protein RRG08_061423 [Elysia crispata]